jgi:hypothetical protein
MQPINTRYAERQPDAAASAEAAGRAALADPLRFCIFTTVALIAWVFGPPLAVVLMSGLGLWAYGRAWQRGLRRSKCLLRDARLVLLYLGVAFVAGLFFAARGLAGWL